MLCFAGTVSRIKLNVPACFNISASFFEFTTSCAPSRTASALLLGLVVNTTTSAPNAAASFKPKECVLYSAASFLLRWDLGRRLQMAQFQLNKQATVMTKLTELLRIKVIVKLKELGEVRGVIEEIVAPAIADDLQRSIDLTQFKVRLESGETVTVPGSAFSKIEYAITRN